MVKRLEPRLFQCHRTKQTSGQDNRTTCVIVPDSVAVVLGLRVPIMPNKVVETPYPLIDADPHASRVVRYFRPSDYAAWASATVAFPAALYAWGMKFSQLCFVFDKAYRDG